MLDSVNNIERVAPKPFFYTRLEARLLRDERNIWEKMSRVITRPAIAALALSLVLLVNVFVIVQEVSVSDPSPDLSELASSEELRSSFYDMENIQP